MRQCDNCGTIREVVKVRAAKRLWLCPTCLAAYSLGRTHEREGGRP